MTIVDGLPATSIERWGPIHPEAFCIVAHWGPVGKEGTGHWVTKFNKYEECGLDEFHPGWLVVLMEQPTRCPFCMEKLE